MTSQLRFRSLAFLFLLLAAAPALRAQVQVDYLRSDPARAALRYPTADPATARRGQALSLPFFDDFTTPQEGLPDPQRWVPAGGAYVSNRLALNPPTRGAATLDGLTANGQPYNYNPNRSFYEALDVLTSQPIDLSGLGAGGNVYLSFAWQAGSIVGSPQNNTNSQPVRLDLEFKNASGTWTRVWRQLSTGRRTGFRQQVLALDPLLYLHGAFQFRFQATGLSENNRDAWSVDYVLLDANRNAADTTRFADIATSRRLNSPLRRYTSMPVWQYNVDPVNELNSDLSTTINNLVPASTAGVGNPPTPISWEGTVRNLSGGSFAATWLPTGSRSVTAGIRQDPIQGSARTAPLPTTPDPKVLRYSLALRTGEQNPLTLPNDTIWRDLRLDNYYAYDDGTAEQLVNLQATSTGPPSYFAYRIDLNQADEVRGLRLYPIFRDSVLRAVTVNVWDISNGQPATSAARVSQSFTFTPRQAQRGYIDLAFTTPVPVAGSFLIGYGQPSNGNFLHYGLDLSSTVPTDYLWQNVGGAWQAVNSLGGAPMMRPLMSNFQVVTSTAASAKDAFSIYPNPTRGHVTVDGPRFRRAEVLDALGRPVWQQPAAEAGQPTLALPALPAGLYLVRLTLPDGGTALRRLVVE